MKTLVRWGDEVVLPGHVELLRENALGTCLVAVLSGRLSVTKETRHEGTVEPGGWVGDVAILGLGPQPATVTTACESAVFALSARAVVSFAVTLPGLRHGLFPGLDEAEASEHVRRMRHDGLAAWRSVRIPVPTELAARPAWLRAYPSRTRRVTTRLLPRALSPRPDPPRPPSRRHKVAGWSAAGAGVLGCLLAFVAVHIPYYSVAGATRSATDSIHVDGATTYPPRGRVLFPIVITRRCTPLTAARDWIDGIDVRSQDDVFGSATPAAADRINLELMGGSKHAAEAAGLRLVAARLSADRVRIDTGHLGGPSAGLAFTLALVDALTPGELTGGHTVAATGTITDGGEVGPVGGISFKARAARAAGAELFLVPVDNFREAAANAGGMRVVAVRDLSAALRALSALSAAGPAG